MARRRKTSFADDFTAVVARLPWWLAIALAVVLYMVLHPLAERPIAIATQPGQVGAMAVHTIWKTLASVGQYLLPALCLVAAAISVARRKKRQGLVQDAVHSAASDALEGISWRDFELLVGEGFRLQGYRVVESGGGGPDGGVDLVLSRPAHNGAEKVLVQCKQWRAFKVGVDVVRELYGVMAARGAAGGFVVTSGRFTKEAVRFAEGRNVTLVDGPRLHRMLQDAKASRTRPPAAVRAKPFDLPSVQPVATQAPVQADVPNCPLCAKPMQRRVAKRGARAGVSFWGCTAYPACRGSRPID